MLLNPPTPSQIPSGYELTGEYREIRLGDFYWTDRGCLAHTVVLHPGNRWILHKKGQQKSESLPPKPTQTELDSETIPGYTGFECTDTFRIPKAGDVFYNPKHGVLRTDWDFKPTESPRWILRRKGEQPKSEELPLGPEILSWKPTVTQIQHTVDNSAYSAWVCSDEFRVPVRGDVFWSHSLGYVCVAEGQHTPGENNDRRWILKAPPTLIAALPPPPQAWLDKHKVKLTGEYRPAREGELIPWMISQTRYGDLDVHGPWTMHRNNSTTIRWILAPL